MKIRLFSEDDDKSVEEFQQKYKGWEKLPEIDIPEVSVDFIRKMRDTTSVKRSDLIKIAKLFAEEVSK